MSHNNVSRRAFLSSTLAASIGFAADDGWISLFDGHSLNGWKPSENKSSWQVVDGALTANGPRSHLFYAGETKNANFRNFELQVDWTTRPQCNSGIYFHTAYQEKGFPDKGFEIQINNTALGDGGYLERKKTGSLYGLRNMYKQLIPDEKPSRMHVTVRGKNVQIRLNGELLVDYVEPTPPVIPAGGEKQRFLDRGTFALQCHNDGSRVAYRSVRVRPLADDLPDYVGPVPVADETFRRVIDIGRHNVPLVDYHVYLRDRLTLEDALHKSRQDGLQYGICVNAAALKSDAEADRWLRPYLGKPVFSSLVTDNGDWVRAVSKQTALRFDCVLADGRSLQKSVPPESDRDHYMDTLVARIVARLDSEPIDIYAFPLYLPPALQPDSQRLWSATRTQKLIAALSRNKTAIELNSVERIPSQEFIVKAKEAGCKFAFGTGNSTAADLQRCEYGLQMVEDCKLEWHDFYTPGSWWPKAVERRWPAS